MLCTLHLMRGPHLPPGGGRPAGRRRPRLGSAGETPGEFQVRGGLKLGRPVGRKSRREGTRKGCEVSRAEGRPESYRPGSAPARAPRLRVGSLSARESRRGLGRQGRSSGPPGGIVGVTRSWPQQDAGTSPAPEVPVVRAAVGATAP